MGLSSDLISQFVKITNDNSKKTPTETTVYGTTVNYNGKTYVKIDGSDLLTPVNTTTSMKEGDRVTVAIKDHSATVTGNISDPSASSAKVEKQGSRISEFEIVMAYKVSTEDLEAVNAAIENLRATTARLDDATIVNAEIEKLEALYANVEYLTATDLEAITAQIETLEAEFGTFTDLSTDDLEAITANITNLKGYTASFTYLTVGILDAMAANIKNLEVDKLSATDADLKYVNIDFSNIDKAWMDEFYAKSGLIENVILGDGTVTGYLVGVTIKGDTIEGGTIIADKLVIKGDDGLYYKLNTDGETVESEQTEYNSLNGSIITAKSVTAEKISVSDLVAFDATIGGFNITDDSIYSGVKSTVDNTTRGVYLDNDGQMSLGDADNYIRYRKYTEVVGVVNNKVAVTAVDDNGYYIYDYTGETADLEGYDIESVGESTMVDGRTVTVMHATSPEDAVGFDYIVEDIIEDRYKLEIAAESVKFSTIDELANHIQITTFVDVEDPIQYRAEYDSDSLTCYATYERVNYKIVERQGLGRVCLRDGSYLDCIGWRGITEDGETVYYYENGYNEKPCIELREDDTSFKLRITNNAIYFVEEDVNHTKVATDGLTTDNITINNELRQGSFAWVTHGGNYGLIWKGE